jgi:cyanate lyase
VTAAGTGTLPHASVADTLAVVAAVFARPLTKGALLRRPEVVAAAERLQLDRRTVRRLQRLRGRDGAGSVLPPTPLAAGAPLPATLKSYGRRLAVGGRPA